MPVSHVVWRVRARLAVAAGLAALATALLLVPAGPAGAQTPPPDDVAVDVERPRFGFDIVALIAALERAGEPAAPKSCADAGPEGVDVPQLVVEIFNCRMLEAGMPPEEARYRSAEALVVSRCESLWDHEAVVFDGRYLDQAHPRTGSRYSAAGVFQFIRSTADTWIDGGYARVTDARRNIDAAARLYLHNRVGGRIGWEDWACAAANDGFKVGSVLPGWPGGPAHLPEWVEQHLP